MVPGAQSGKILHLTTVHPINADGAPRNGSREDQRPMFKPASAVGAAPERGVVTGGHKADGLRTLPRPGRGRNHRQHPQGAADSRVLPSPCDRAGSPRIRRRGREPLQGLGPESGGGPPARHYFTEVVLLVSGAPPWSLRCTLSLSVASALSPGPLGSVASALSAGPLGSVAVTGACCWTAGGRGVVVVAPAAFAALPATAAVPTPSADTRAADTAILSLFRFMIDPFVRSTCVDTGTTRAPRERSVTQQHGAGPDEAPRLAARTGNRARGQRAGAGAVPTAASSLTANLAKTRSRSAAVTLWPAARNN